MRHVMQRQGCAGQAGAGGLGEACWAGLGEPGWGLVGLDVAGGGWVWVRCVGSCSLLT